MVYCSNYGTINEDMDKYCSNCGQILSKSGTVPQEKFGGIGAGGLIIVIIFTIFIGWLPGIIFTFCFAFAPISSDMAMIFGFGLGFIVTFLAGYSAIFDRQKKG